jgi:hypothetical protein
MSIPFTQFLRPNGRRMQATIDRSPEIEAKAKELLGHGCLFEIEQLQTGEISMEVVRGEKILAGEICPNGPEVCRCVDKMINEAHALFNSNKL